MTNRNETPSRQCRFLDQGYFKELYEAFILAFSDYVLPFALTEDQFRNHIKLTGVDLSRTVGFIDEGKIVGFSLNGFGDWNGLPTAYDAGTGVIPSHRRQHISERMFEMMMPVFTEQGFKQILLEVISNNTAAVKLYEKLGFRMNRELALLQCDKRIDSEAITGIEVREIEPQWELLMSFWSAQTAWQNSVEAVERSRPMKRVLGAFAEGECAGYIVFSKKFGRISQMAVSPRHRHRHVGLALIQAMQAETAEGYSLQVINIDKSITSAMEFFKGLGFYERLSQFEMIRPL